MQFIIPFAFLLLATCQLAASSPILAVDPPPPQEISSNKAGASFVDPSVAKKPGVFTIPLTGEHAYFRRGPMTRKATYDPVKNITHIWDMKRGSYTLPGNHINDRSYEHPRRYDQQN